MSVPLDVPGSIAASGMVKVAGTGSEQCASTNFGTLRVNPVDGSLELCRQ